MTNSRYDSSASALIKTLNWPTVADMIKVETACMVYKSINDLAPDYLSEIFTKNSACRRKNLRNTATDLQVPLMKTCNGQRACSENIALYPFRVGIYVSFFLRIASLFLSARDNLRTSK